MLKTFIVTAIRSLSEIPTQVEEVPSLLKHTSTYFRCFMAGLLYTPAPPPKRIFVLDIDAFFSSHYPVLRLHFLKADFCCRCITMLRFQWLL